jgi:hypothetical protein
VTTLITLYPDSDEQQYRLFVKDYKAIIPDISDVFALMGSCDLYVVNTGCSTLPLAIGAHKPAVTFNFLKDNARPHYNLKAGVVQVMKRDQFLPVLEKILGDKAEYERLVELQKKAALELCMLDGQCTKRVMDQIEDLLTTSSRATR